VRTPPSTRTTQLLSTRPRRRKSVDHSDLLAEPSEIFNRNHNRLGARIERIAHGSSGLLPATGDVRRGSPCGRSLDVGQLHVSPGVSIGQAPVIHPEQVEDGGPQVLDGHRILDGLVAPVVGPAVGDPRLHAPSGQASQRVNPLQSWSRPRRSSCGARRGAVPGTPRARVGHRGRCRRRRGSAPGRRPTIVGPQPDPAAAGRTSGPLVERIRTCRPLFLGVVPTRMSVTHQVRWVCRSEERGQSEEPFQGPSSPRTLFAPDAH
jgi:hypothetical protein